MQHRFMLTPMHMDSSMGKIRQPAGMVKVEVCQNNMLDGLCLVTESSKLADCRHLRVNPYAQVSTEKAHQPGWTFIVVEAQTGIHQDKALVSIDEQTGRTQLPSREPG
jgi:hypothetical protein